jgi:hypothetical protein
MARRTPLVTQHLENISRKVLEEHQQIVREYVRHRQGIYALFRRGKLYYVGLASNLVSRLGHHLKDRHQESWDRFSVYLTIEDSHLRELEALILRVATPPGNKQKGKFAKSEDMRRRFSSDLQKSMRSSLDELLGREPKKEQPPKKKVSAQKGKTPILARYTQKAITLKGKHKDKTYWAYVRKSGLIFFDKKHFNSPSDAGAHAVKRTTCNGWTFWKYQRSPGDWVNLDVLRKK